MDRIGDRGALEAFVRSVELGSFSAAARELKLSPSAISKLVTRLERSLRVPLVNRSTRRLAATAEGELFLARCRRILGEFDEAESELVAVRERPRGRLRMHVAVGFAMHQVVPALPRFLERHPDVQVELLVEDRNIELVKEDVDLSVRPGPPLDTSLVARAVFQFERVVCASPIYIARHGAPRTPQELAQHRCIVVSGFPGRAEWPFRMPGGRQVVEVSPLLKANNADAVLKLALLGLGIVRLNEFVVADQIHAGGLVPVLQEFHASQGDAMLALYPQLRNRPARVVAMLAFLDSEFGARPWRQLRA